ncbi:MAG: stage II sporulation protein M [Thermoproteota archaeon]|nr:stage II sporulation protein M [Thermoproteota archaeon]
MLCSSYIKRQSWREGGSGEENDKTNYTIYIQLVLLRFEINKRRLIYLAFGVVAFLSAYSIGAAVPMSEDQAQTLTREFSKQIEGIDQNGIFLNNIRITMVMFVPAVGSAFGAFSGFATGSIFSALVSSSPILGKVPPLALLITPFGIMEVFAYGLAMSRSVMLIYYLLKRISWRKYTVPTLIELGIAAGVLFVAAVIEWQMIEQLGGLDASIAIDPVRES